MENQSQPSYSMYNFDEDKGFVVGFFDNDEKFWEHYFANQESIDVKCKQLDAGNWHMHRSGREIAPTIEPVRLVEPEDIFGDKVIIIDSPIVFAGKSTLTENYIHKIMHDAEKEGRKVIIVDDADNTGWLRELAAAEFKSIQNIPIIAPPPMVEIGGFTPPKTRGQIRKEQRDSEKKKKKK